MFAGETRQVELKIKKDCLPAIFDYFGDQFTIMRDKEEDPEYKHIRIKTNLDGMYYWALQYGDNVEILSPQELRDNIRRTVTRMSQTYTITNDDRYSEALRRSEDSTRIPDGIEDKNFRSFLNYKRLNLTGIDLNGKKEHKNLKDITVLEVGDNSISDYSFINNYENLRYLTIRADENIDLSQLYSDTLTSLTLTGTYKRLDPLHIDNLDFLQNFPNIRNIYLGHLEVNNYDYLYNNENLRRLQIDKEMSESFDQKKFKKKPLRIREEHHSVNFFFIDVDRKLTKSEAKKLSDALKNQAEEEQQHN